MVSNLTLPFGTVIPSAAIIASATGCTLIHLSCVETSRVVGSVKSSDRINGSMFPMKTELDTCSFISPCYREFSFLSIYRDCRYSLNIIQSRCVTTISASIYGGGYVSGRYSAPEIAGIVVFRVYFLTFL